MDEPTKPTDIIRRAASFAPIIGLALMLSGGWRGVYFVGFMLVAFTMSFWWLSKHIAVEDEPPEDSP